MECGVWEGEGDEWYVVRGKGKGDEWSVVCGRVRVMS